MLPQYIIDRARRLSSTSSSYYSDVDGLADLNQVKNDLWSTIVTYVNENFNWQEWYTSSVIGQGEYSLPPVSTTLQGAKKIKDIKVAYTSTPYAGTSVLQWVKAKEVDPSTLEKPWTFYQQFQDPNKPMYYVADNSFFIAPLPTSNVTNGIVVTGIRNIPDYTLASVEADMVIPLDMQENLVYGLIPYIFDMKTMATEAANARAIYEQRKKEMVNNLSDRVVAPFFSQFPDDIAAQVTGPNILNA